jgi:uroporphyrinogen-III synthase
MNIIFTRPLLDSEDFMMNFLASGHKIIHMPTLNIATADMKPINTKDYDGLIFTSANAVRFLKLKNNDKNIKCFCVGSLTERALRQKGFNNTIAASGTVYALKNLIVNSAKNIKKLNLAYLCGDVVAYELDKELKLEGLKVSKFINYTSNKITNLNKESMELIKKYPPDVTLIYSKRSAESFDEISRKYSLGQLMTQCKVMCISKKIEDFLKSKGWNKTEVFNPGEELIKINQIKNGHS